MFRIKYMNLKKILSFKYLNCDLSIFFFLKLKFFSVLQRNLLDEPQWTIDQALNAF